MKLFDHSQTLGKRITAAFQLLVGRQVSSPLTHAIDEWDQSLPFAIHQDHIEVQQITGGPSGNAHKTLLLFPQGTQVSYRELPHLKELHLIKTFVLPSGNEYSFIYARGRGRYYSIPEGTPWQVLDEPRIHQRLLDLISLRTVPNAADIALLDHCLLDLDLLAP